MLWIAVGLALAVGVGVALYYGSLEAKKRR